MVKHCDTLETNFDLRLREAACARRTVGQVEIGGPQSAHLLPNDQDDRSSRGVYVAQVSFYPYCIVYVYKFLPNLLLATSQKAHVHAAGWQLKDKRAEGHGGRLPRAVRHLRLLAFDPRWRPRHQSHRC